MAKVEFARDKLRTKFLKLMDEYEAMIVFLVRMDQPLQKKLATQRDAAIFANKCFAPKAMYVLREFLCGKSTTS